MKTNRRSEEPPLVSVIIPTYNSANYIALSIDSAIKQTMRDFEIIVVEDGSTDDTKNRLDAYRNIINCIYQSNHGRSFARNVAIRQARGKYIAFLDSDDLWLPDRLEKQVAILEASPEIQLVYSKAKIIDSLGNAHQVWGHPSEIGEAIMEPGRIYEQLILGNFIPILTVTLRRSALEQAGYFDEQLSYPEDWDLWLRLAHPGNFFYIPETLACYRIEDEVRTARLSASTEIVDQQIYVLEKSFHSQTQPQVELEKLARAWVYARAAMAAVQIGDTSSASWYWKEAVKACSTFLEGNEVQKLSKKAIYNAHKMEDRSGYDRAVQYLKNYSVSLPVSEHRRNRILRELLNEYYLDAVFEAHARKDYATVRRFLIPCLTNSPDCITNRALWKIAMVAMIRH